MRRTGLLLLWALGGAFSCGAIEREDETDALLPLAFTDARARLSAGTGDPLVVIHFPADACEDGLALSGLHLEISAQGCHYSNAWNLSYALTTDVDADGRFGPGDQVTVSEQGRGDFSLRSVGAYRVRLFYGNCDPPRLLAIGDWHAE